MLTDLAFFKCCALMLDSRLYHIRQLMIISVCVDFLSFFVLVFYMTGYSSTIHDS